MNISRTSQRTKLKNLKLQTSRTSKFKDLTSSTTSQVLGSKSVPMHASLSGMNQDLHFQFQNRRIHC